MGGERENELDPKKNGKTSSNYINEREQQERQNGLVGSEKEVKDERGRKDELFVNQNLGEYFVSFFIKRVMLLFAENSENFPVDTKT